MIEWGQCGEIAAEDSNPAMRHAQVQLNARDIVDRVEVHAIAIQLAGKIKEEFVTLGRQ